MRLRVLPISAVLTLSPLLAPAQSATRDTTNYRVIDMHMHIYTTDPRWDRRVPNPVTGAPLSAATEHEQRLAVLDQMQKHNVVLAVVSTPSKPAAPLHARWMAAAPRKFIPAVAFDAPDEITPQAIRAQHAAGRIKVIGEIGAPYAGYSAGDKLYEPFFVLAEQLDIPIAVHVGSAGGAATYNGYPKYRMELNRPLLMEDMLARHPRARVQIMHAGWPFTDETVALMKGHPQVYVDIGVISWTQPRAEFYAFLSRLTGAGLSKRIMFGSDQMVWAETIGMAIENVKAAPFLSREQKADILCRNAARFLRLKPSPC